MSDQRCATCNMQDVHSAGSVHSRWSGLTPSRLMRGGTIKRVEWSTERSDIRHSLHLQAVLSQRLTTDSYLGPNPMARGRRISKCVSGMIGPMCSTVSDPSSEARAPDAGSD